MNARLTLAVLAGAVALAAAAPAFAQAKSNIQDDPNSASCSTNCVDAGYEWAIANTPANEADCAAKNEDFAAGCAHWVTEQAELAAPPLEEPAEAAAPAADAAAAPAPPADDATDAAATQVDDSAAPPSADPANPPANQ
jgi:hypothetical protein